VASSPTAMVESSTTLFAESTLACDIDDFTDEGGRQVVDQEVETQMVLDEPTQAVSGDNEDFSLRTCTF
jgi:hypothetical protein